MPGFQQMLTYLLETRDLHVSSLVLPVLNKPMYSESRGSDRGQRASKSKVGEEGITRWVVE